MITDLDKIGFQLIHSLHGNISILDSLFVFIAGYSKIFMALILLIGILGIIKRELSVTKEKNKALKTLFFNMALIGFLILVPILLSNLLRELIMRPRPFVVFDIIPMIEQEIRPSLPSNHTTASFAIAGLFLTHMRSYFPYVGIIAALVGFSRIYTGIHFPLDIISGALLGLLPAITYLLVSRKTSNKTYQISKRFR
ncbi:phosphatase PAP2 family protein [Natranaerobius trueperi]|uniref:Phosphatidic acid phosphatase type 2/haloperoxidase domain-containing protein n=1 Tax=Natranaerobius trueperi TaxID=759412 RepID=A0A226C0X9_9FIRM|nr:phosphatase PAP2 family protein [Natranaerobius trueperi]OWZ84886.1 hypothetical protein CDO51_00320 [Natranaerobius trueperi]